MSYASNTPPTDAPPVPRDSSSPRRTSPTYGIRKTAKSAVSVQAKEFLLLPTVDGRAKNSSVGNEATPKSSKKSKKVMEEEDYISAFLKQKPPAPKEPQKYLYDGQTRNGKLHGYGRIVKRNFAMYEGQFVDNRREGFGLEIYPNSDVYLGQFQKDKKWGVGVYFFAVGGFYHGLFEAGQRSEFGLMRNRHGKLTYRGFWKADLKEGRGKEFYKNGSRYDGFFVADQREGVGFMEYSKSLQYLGLWKAGLKHGAGIVDTGKSTISGVFAKDEFQEQDYHNVSEHTEALAAAPNYMNVEEYIRENRYPLKKGELQNVSQIYTLIKEPLVEYVLGLVGCSTVRLSCYQLVKTVFSSALRFEYFMDDILLQLRYEPSLEKLRVFWDPELLEILHDRVNFDWNEMAVRQKSTTVVFDKDAKGLETFDLSLESLDSTTRLVITNQIVTGTKGNSEVEGVLHDRGTNIRFYDSETHEWVRTAYLTIYPFFLLQECNNQLTVLHSKCAVWTGEFYMGKDQKRPYRLKMVLNVGDDGLWYFPGIDEVGAFILAGKYDRLHMTGTLVQRYVQNYRIEYNMFLVSGEKLQGTWSTTSLSGHFILRRDPLFKFTHELSRAIKDLSAKNNGLHFSGYRDSDILRSYFEQSILAVVLEKTQGGIRDAGAPADDSKDIELFERFKKLKEEENSHLDRSFKKNTIVRSGPNDSKLQSGFRMVEEGDLISPMLASKARTSLMDLQRKTIEGMIEEVRPTLESGSSAELGMQREFDASMNGLRQMIQDTTARLDRTDSDEPERLAWIGQVETFGKKEVVMFDNMYIRADMIEGVLTDLDRTVYELAGSYSGRTKEFEMVGMSLNKKQTLKIKGSVQGFSLVGELTRRHGANKVSKVTIDLFGKDAKVTINMKNDLQVLRNLPAIVKRTDQFLYGMVQVDSDLVFLNGVWQPGTCILEINSFNKRIQTRVLTLAEKWTDEQRTAEAKIPFTSNSIDLTIEM